MANVNAYIKGRPAPDVHESHHHLMPIKTYMGVFGALMVLTVITVLVSYADLGPAALPVAMAESSIAEAKTRTGVMPATPLIPAASV